MNNSLLTLLSLILESNKNNQYNAENKCASYSDLFNFKQSAQSELMIKSDFIRGDYDDLFK